MTPADDDQATVPEHARPRVPGSARQDPINSQVARTTRWLGVGQPSRKRQLPATLGHPLVRVETVDGPPTVVSCSGGDRTARLHRRQSSPVTGAAAVAPRRGLAPLGDVSHQSRPARHHAACRRDVRDVPVPAVWREPLDTARELLQDRAGIGTLTARTLGASPTAGLIPIVT